MALFGVSKSHRAVGIAHNRCNSKCHPPSGMNSTILSTDTVRLNNIFRRHTKAWPFTHIQDLIQVHRHPSMTRALWRA